MISKQRILGSIIAAEAEVDSALPAVPRLICTMLAALSRRGVNAKIQLNNELGSYFGTPTQKKRMRHTQACVHGRKLGSFYAWLPQE